MTTHRAPHAAPLDAATSGTRRAGAVLTLVLAGLSMFGPFNVDAPLPAFARMGAEFHVEPAAMQQVVSVYLLSFAVMSLFHGPVSDAVGRKPVMTVGIGVYVLASVGCALAPSLPLLLVFRAFQGFAAGAGQIIARAVIRDLFSGPEAQRLMSQVSMIFGLAPAFAPILGGALLTVGDWRSIFWFLTAFGVVMTICVSRFLPETLPVEQRSSLALGPIVSALLAALRSGRFLRIALAASLAFAGQFLFISNAPLFLGGLLGLGENEYWMFFVPMVVCMIAGSWLSARADGHLSAARQASYGLLFALASATVGVVIALQPWGSDVPWALVAPSLTAFGVAVALPVLQLAQLDEFPQARGTAASAGTFVNLVFAAALAGVIGPLVATDLVTMALAAFCCVASGALLWAAHVAARP